MKRDPAKKGKRISIETNAEKQVDNLEMEIEEQSQMKPKNMNSSAIEEESDNEDEGNNQNQNTLDKVADSINALILKNVYTSYSENQSSKCI